MTDHGSDSYAYDAFNQRLRKTENSTSTYYVTSGPQILAEYTADADPDAEYIYGLSGMSVRFDPEVGHRWFFNDHLGSTREMGLPKTSGDPDMLRDYYPYGDNYEVAGNDETAYQFTGKELDNGIGLHYFGSRYYDRSIGRWLAPDPAGQFFSPYVYAANSPLNLVDPDGEFVIPLLAMAAWQGFVNYQITGDIGSSFKAAGISALSSAAGGIASSFAPAGILPGAGYGGATGGVIGGVTSGLSGGSFGSGFANGAISGAVTGGLDGSARYRAAYPIDVGGGNIWTGSTTRFQRFVNSPLEAISGSRRLYSSSTTSGSLSPVSQSNLLTPGNRIAGAAIDILDSGGMGPYSQPGNDCMNFACRAIHDAGFSNAPNDIATNQVRNSRFFQQVMNPSRGDFVIWLEPSGATRYGHGAVYLGQNSVIDLSPRGVQYRTISSINNIYTRRFPTGNWTRNFYRYVGYVAF